MYELYVHPRHRNNLFQRILSLLLGVDHLFVKGNAFKRHLAKRGLLHQTFSPQDETVKRWVEHPETFPEELRDKELLLFGGPREGRDDDDNVVWIGWTNNQVAMFGDPLLRSWYKFPNCAALLKKEIAPV
jgi:hypothetical protein